MVVRASRAIGNQRHGDHIRGPARLAVRKVRKVLTVVALFIVFSPAALAFAHPTGPWWRVAICEEGGRNDPTYGYFGIYSGTWHDYGGLKFAARPGGATWAQQVTVARRVEAKAGRPGYVPDQHSTPPCPSW